MEMQSLYDLMNKVLSDMDLPEDYQKLESFIGKEEKCVAFIEFLLGGFNIDFTDDKDNINSKVLSITKNRAKHSVITFLMGKVLAEFGGVYKAFSAVIGLPEEYNDMIWMFTSLYHDIGYFYPSKLSDINLELEKEFEHFLLEDDNEHKDCFSKDYPDAFSYSYSEIKAYFEYSKDYHLRNTNEKTYYGKEMLDHGVLGGCIAYNQAYPLFENSKDEIAYRVIKTACLSIAQHNIFKSNSAEGDSYYPNELLDKLSYKSEFRISKKCPILFLLSIVDTIEIIKRYCADDSDKDLRKRMHALTILKNIYISVSCEEINITYKKLYNKLFDIGSLEDYIYKHANGIYTMGKWLSVEVKKNADLFSICIK